MTMVARDATNKYRSLAMVIPPLAAHYTRLNLIATLSLRQETLFSLGVSVATFALQLFVRRTHGAAMGFALANERDNTVARGPNPGRTIEHSCADFMALPSELGTFNVPDHVIASEPQ